VQLRSAEQQQRAMLLSAAAADQMLPTACQGTAARNPIVLKRLQEVTKCGVAAECAAALASPAL
jgi:hypothetical protein